MMQKTIRNLALLWLSTAAIPHASAVIILQSESRNLTPPPAAMLPAWNLQGQFGIFNATPISPDRFIAAKHIGGAPGVVFTYAGLNYTTTSFSDIAGTDLRVWKVDSLGGTRVFPSFASVWNPAVDGSEVGRPMVVFGRGTARGEAIYAPINPGPTYSPPRPALTLTGDPTGSPESSPSLGITGPAPTGQGDLRGWKWGATDALQSWGQNKVEFALTDPDYGELVGFNFDRGTLAGPNEAILSSGDSSGGVFVQAASGQWKLVGVNLGTDGPWSFTAAGPYFNAALFDARGVYVGSAANPQLLPYTADALTASSYSTRVASYYGQLTTITNNFGTGVTNLLPEPTTLAVLAMGAWATSRRKRKNS